jgi:arylsulfatase A-like enzyme
MKRLLALVLVASAAAALFAVERCRSRGFGAAPAGTPLLAPPSQVQVLVESRAIAPPPAFDGSRFVTGWRAAGAGGRRFVAADAPVSRLEAVNLSHQARKLVLAFDGAPTGVARVRIAGGRWRRVPIAARTEMELPLPLPIGRFAVELALPAGSPPLLAALDRAGDAGGVRVGTNEVVQAGASLVEIVRPLRGDAVLSGEIAPPRQPRDRQRLELRQRCEGKDRVLWRWRPRWWDPVRRSAFRVRVGCSSGWLQLRLLAPHDGAAATWRRLSIDAPLPRPAEDRSALRMVASRSPRLVLVYVFDALRSDAVGKRGDGQTATPVLDELAANGASFEQHLAVAPSTLPSTKTLFTGRVWRRQGGVRLPPDVPTLAEAFRSAGYRTGLFSGNVYVSRAFGMHRGFQAAPDHTLVGEEEVSGAPNDNAAQVNTAALSWVRGLPADARVFLYLHVIHPHNPYRPPGELDARAAVAGSDVDGSTRTLLAIVHRRRRVTVADEQRIAALYHANLAYADAQLGALLAALRERFAADQSLVVATSDHGEELFDHGGLLHGFTLYEEQIRIPLVVSWPGTVAAQRIPRATSTVDLHSALLAIAQGAPAARPPLGDLLSPHPQDVEDDVHFAAAANVRGGIFAARTPRWKVVWAPRTGMRWGVGEGLGRAHDAELLFDLAQDPRERRNLAGIVDEPEVLWLRAKLKSWVAQADGEGDGQDSYDAETRARLRALGYVQ